MSREAYNYSDEILNAYLDDELAAEERKRLIEDLRQNDGLRQRVCRLEQVRNMVSIAYHDIPDPLRVTKTRVRGFSSLTAIAASIMVFVGIAGGWLGHSYLRTNTSLLEMADTIQINNPPNTAQPWRVLMHVTSDDNFRLGALLDEAEIILKNYKKNNKKVSIQILANGKGLNLLRDDKSPFGQRIEALNKRYKNIAFVACARAIQRLETEQGVTVKLLPDTKITPSAMQEVLKRQRDGWTYIKI